MLSFFRLFNTVATLHGGKNYTVTHRSAVKLYFKLYYCADILYEVAKSVKSFRVNTFNWLSGENRSGCSGINQHFSEHCSCHFQGWHQLRDGNGPK